MRRIDLPGVRLYHGDCLEVMKSLPDNCIDAVVGDPPYGATRANWDSIIDIAAMWEGLRRIVKADGAICLFAIQPFASLLIGFNPTNFRYDWIWEKNAGGNFLNSNRTPLRRHEQILVFSQAAPYYNPQKTPGAAYTRSQGKVTNLVGDTRIPNIRTESDGGRFPTTILRFDTVPVINRLHESQKPVDLLAYLIRTYSRKNEVILDFSMGSGSTGEAALLEGRTFIGIDKELAHFTTSLNRLGSLIVPQREEE